MDKEKETGKRLYEAPTVEVIRFEVTDIITSSNDLMLDLEYEEEE